ncbi:MAG: phosphate signaling complex protein PhoU [Endomicrobium sp.]|jgi:phosphate transport system protein|nr:phosphate signaling complex protein PhoU [Endomicrobium sp.]
MFSEKIVLLKKGIIDYAEHVEKMIVESLERTMKRDEAVLHNIIEKEEAVANRYEIEFDEICVNYIARYQPAGKNLRMIISAIKMSNDLERMADHAVNIAQNGLFLISHPFVKPFIDIPKMSEITVSMLKNAIKSFVDEDMHLAKKVLENDGEVDSLKIKTVDEITYIMSEEPKTVSRALKIINIVSNLERVADLATNICEDVIYLTDGMIVKHHQADA